MSAAPAAIMGYGEPTYPVGHPGAPQFIPRNECIVCHGLTACAVYFNNVGQPNDSRCGCGCHWHSHKPLSDVFETIERNRPYARGGCEQTHCSQYYTPIIDWSARPVCVCRRLHQSHGRLVMPAVLAVSTNPVVSAPDPQVAIPLLPGRLTSAPPVVPASIPGLSTFTGFLGHQLPIPSATNLPCSETNQNDTSSPSLMSADFIRRFRARSEYAVVPPRRQLIGRALAPKPVPPSRSVAALKSGYSSKKRAKPHRSVAAFPSTIQKFDIALIPIPVGVDTPSLIDGKLGILSSFTQHRNLLDRLRRANLIIPCRFDINLEGANLVEEFQRQVSQHCTQYHVVFPPAPEEDQTEFRAMFASIHDLPFALLEVTTNHHGNQPRFRKTRITQPLTMQLLLSTLFSKRIVNTLHPQELIPMLFIAPAHGLLRMPIPEHPELLRIIRFSVAQQVPVGIQPVLHACIGPLIMNGYVNDSTAAIDANLLVCLDGCDDYIPTLEIADESRPAIAPPANRNQTRRRTKRTVNRTRADRIGDSLPPREIGDEVAPAPEVIDLTRSLSPPYVTSIVTSSEIGVGALDRMANQLHSSISPLRVGQRIPGLFATSVPLAAKALQGSIYKFAGSQFNATQETVASLLESENISSLDVEWRYPNPGLLDLFDPHLAISIDNGSISVGRAIKTSVLQELLQLLINNAGSLWQADSSGLYSLQPPPQSSLPLGLQAKPSVKTMQGWIRIFATGIATALLLYHARLAPPISPILFAISLLDEKERMAVTHPKFLELMDKMYKGSSLALLVEKASRMAPLGDLQPFAQVAELHPDLCEAPRDESVHKWVVFKIVLAFFGISGVGDSTRTDFPEISAFVNGFRAIQSLCPTVQIPSLSITDQLSLIKTLYDRCLERPDDLIDNIKWSVDAGCDPIDAARIKDAFCSFVRGQGVPPLASYLVSPDEYRMAQQDPCYRAKRLLSACRSFDGQPIGDSGQWIRVCLKTPTFITEVNSTSQAAVRYHACFGSLDIHVTPLIPALAATPEMFSAFLFHSMPLGHDFSGD